MESQDPEGKTQKVKTFRHIDNLEEYEWTVFLTTSDDVWELEGTEKDWTKS